MTRMAPRPRPDAAASSIHTATTNRAAQIPISFAPARRGAAVGRRTVRIPAAAAPTTTKPESGSSCTTHEEEADGPGSPIPARRRSKPITRFQPNANSVTVASTSAQDRVEYEDLARPLDRRVSVDRLEPGARGSVQTLERLRFGRSRPEEHGVLMGRSFREEAFEVRTVCEDDRHAGRWTLRRESDSTRFPWCEPARSGFVDADHRDERLRAEVPEPRGRLGKGLGVREGTPCGVGGRELQPEPVICDLAHLHVSAMMASGSPSRVTVRDRDERGLVRKYRAAGCRSGRPAETGVERVAEGIAEEVEGEDG